MMNGRYQQWNSRNFDLTDEEEAQKYQYLTKVLCDFDWVVEDVAHVYTVDRKSGSIHIGVHANKTFEVWLLKHDFEKV